LTPSPGAYDFGYVYDNNCASANTYQWNFGDGNTSTDENPSHTYQSFGTYTVHLQITDTNGCCSAYSIVIVYGTVPPSNVICEPLCSGFVIDQGFENFTDLACDNPNFVSQFANNCITNWFPANGTADVFQISNNESGYEGNHYARFVEHEAVYTPFNIRKYRKYRLDLAAKFYSGPNNIPGTLGVYAASGITPNPSNTMTPLYISNLNSLWPKIGEMNLTGTSSWMTDCFEFELASNQSEYSALLFQPYISSLSSIGKEIRMDKVRFTCELKIMRDIQEDYVSGGLFNFTPILNYQDVTGRIEYFWNFGDGQTTDNQSNPSHTYTFAGVYNVCVTARDEDGCCETFCKEIRFDDGSCILEPGFTFIDASSPEGGNITSFVSGNTLQNVKWQVKGNLVINTNFTFISAELKMEDGAMITVNPGSDFKITSNSYIHGCNTMWKGIFFTGEDEYEINNSTINDAETAINIKGVATVHLIGNTFDKNWISIDADQTSYPIGYFAGNVFDCTAPLLDPYTGQLLSNHGPVSYCGARANRVGFFDLKLDYPNNGPDLSPNVFQNIRNGIRVFNSISTRSESNQFFNIIPQNENDCTFLNSETITSHFKNNILNRGHKGVVLSFPKSTYIMTGNRISDYNVIYNNSLSEVCWISQPQSAFINISNNPNTSNSHLGYRISNGTAKNIYFKNNNLINVKTGFQTADISANSIKVENDSIVIFCTENPQSDAAISFYNTYGADAYMNRINLIGTEGFFLIGLNKIFSGLGVMNDNRIFDTNPEILSTGININGSAAGQYYCNKIYNTNEGVSFRNPCATSILETTSLNNINSYSIRLNNTEISRQQYNGNTFLSANNSQSRARIDLGNGSIFNNNFIYNPNDPVSSGSLVPDILETQPPNLNWFIADFENDNDKCSGISGIDQNKKTVNLELIAQGNALNNQYYAQNNWTSKFQLYQLLDHEPNLLDSNLNLQSFYMENSEVKQYYNHYKAVYNLNSICDSSDIAIENIVMEFDSNSSRLEEIVHSIYGQENTPLIDSSILLKITIANYQHLLQNKYDSINSEKLLIASDLFSEISNLSENEIFCNAFKQILRAKVDLFRFGNDFVKSTYTDSLVVIAELCEFEYGIPVYLAQSLCESLNISYERNSNACQANRISKAATYSTLGELQLQPNPVTDKLVILANQPITTVSIVDITGKMARQLSFDEYNDRVEVDCLSLSAGSYFVNITCTNGQKQVAKFIKL
jgi:hypothetical protein